LVLGPEARPLEAGDVVQWTSARNGYEAKLFRVDGVVYKSNLDVILDLTEVDPSDYDWDQATDYRPVIDGPLALVGPRPMPMTGWQVFPWEVEDEQGRARRPSILVLYASGLSSVERVRVQVRVGDENGALIFDSDAHPYAAPWYNVLQGQFPANTPVSVRGIFIGPPAAEWSGWFAITTPDIKLSALDVVYENIDLPALADDIQGYLAWAGNSREELEQAQALALSTADEILANYAAHQQIRRELTMTAENVTAKYLEAITVATGPGSAIVNRIETLEVTVEEDLASAVSALTTQIETVGNEVTAVAQDLTALETKANDDVSSAITLLQSEIGTVDGKTKANAQAITALNAEVDGVAASITIRAEAVAGGTGGWVRYAIYLNAEDTEAAFFIEVNGSQSRIVNVADQFVVMAPGFEGTPFIFDGSAIRVANAFIKDLTADNISASFIDSIQVNADEVLAQDATISGVLQVGPHVFIQGPEGRILVTDNT
jgi:hypothetical protein